MRNACQMEIFNARLNMSMSKSFHDPFPLLIVFGIPTDAARLACPWTTATFLSLTISQPFHRQVFRQYRELLRAFCKTNMSDHCGALNPLSDARLVNTAADVIE